MANWTPAEIPGGPYTVTDGNATTVTFINTYVPPVLPQIKVVKTLNGDNPFLKDETISFTIQVTNTGTVVINTLPLEDLYNSVYLEYEPAGTTPAPDNASAGLLTWTDLLDSLSDTDGLAPTESVSVDVFFKTKTDTTLAPAFALCAAAGHTPNIARSVGAVGNGITVVEDTDDTSCAEVQITSPTAVQLAARSVSQTDDGVLVKWATASDSTAVGFHVWKLNGVTAEQLTTEMLSARSVQQSISSASASAAAYEWLDEGATLRRGDTYMLEMIQADGSTERTVIDVVNGTELYLPFLFQ